jgi:hypothetical protein
VDKDGNEKVSFEEFKEAVCASMLRKGVQKE